MHTSDRNCLKVTKTVSSGPKEDSAPSEEITIASGLDNYITSSQTQLYEHNGSWLTDVQYKDVEVTV